ncbi:hydrolase [Liquorilactobacillus mali]|nr:hydrolase [Liquorilactobacillus mali]
MNSFKYNVSTNLRKQIVPVPSSIGEASGISFMGRNVKSIIFTTDIAIVRNTNADAIWAVYPFTPDPAIMQAIHVASDKPVFSGVGGGLTSGKRSADMSLFAESWGSLGVIVNAPTSVDTIKLINDVIDIPIIMTVISADIDFDEKFAAGIDVINVSGGRNTAKIVKEIRMKYPEVPLIATGGHSDESICSAIAAGANAIIYTPPTTSSLFSRKMKEYREFGF